MGAIGKEASGGASASSRFARPRSPSLSSSEEEEDDEDPERDRRFLSRLPSRSLSRRLASLRRFFSSFLRCAPQAGGECFASGAAVSEHAAAAGATHPFALLLVLFVVFFFAFFAARGRGRRPRLRARTPLRAQLQRAVRAAAGKQGMQLRQQQARARRELRRTRAQRTARASQRRPSATAWRPRPPRRPPYARGTPRLSSCTGRR